MVGNQESRAAERPFLPFVPVPLTATRDTPAGKSPARRCAVSRLENRLYVEAAGERDTHVAQKLQELVSGRQGGELVAYQLLADPLPELLAPRGRRDDVEAFATPLWAFAEPLSLGR